MKLIYILAFLLVSFNVSGTDNNSSEILKKIKENGILLKDETITYTDHQYYLLSSFDFTPYRNYSTKRLILIEDGPMIEILSLSEMQKIGKDIPSEYIELKKNEVEESNLKGIITKINIGFRFGPKKNTETGF